MFRYNGSPLDWKDKQRNSWMIRRDVRFYFFDVLSAGPLDKVIFVDAVYYCMRLKTIGIK
jgi:hypothetical protein